MLMSTFKISLIASLIGSAAGYWAWKLDLTKMFWPEHPQLAGFFLTIVVAVAVQLTWPMFKSKA
jgi:hypothetical protein